MTSWLAYEELLDRAEAAQGALRNSLEALCDAAKPIKRALRSGERRVNVARGYDLLRARAVETPYARLENRYEPAIGRTVVDLSPCAFDLSGAAITQAGAVIVDDTAFVSEFRSSPKMWRDYGFWGMARSDFGFAGYDRSSETCVVDHPDRMPSLPREDVYFLFNSNLARSNFGHFVHDLLGQLCVYHHLERLLRRKLRPLLMGGVWGLTRSDGSPFRYEMLSFLFEQLIAPVASAVVIGPAGARVPHCFSAKTAMPAPAFPGEVEVSVGSFVYAHERLREIATRHADPARSHVRIHVSRADAPASADRCFSNLNEAELLLAERGFSSLTVGSMSVVETLAAFAPAEHICGIHGAGLVNFVFASRPVLVTEIMDHPTSWPSIALLGVALGMDVRRVSASPPGQETGGRPSIDLNRLAEAVARRNPRSAG